MLWDVLPTGKVPGGAPCNFVYHAMEAGCEGHLISAIGDDKSGNELLKILEELNINNKYIQVNNFPTSTVTVKLNDKGNPDYIIHENVAWDHIRMTPDIQKLSESIDAVCFGSLAQRSPESENSIQAMLLSLKKDCIKVFDINLRQNYFTRGKIQKSIEIADIVKLNENELPVVSGYFGFSGDIRNQLMQMLSHFRLKYIVYTMGEKGSIIMGRDEYSQMEVPDTIVADTVGAGDAFTGIMVAGLLQKKPLTEIHRKANEIAAYVCTQKGATPKFNNKIF